MSDDVYIRRHHWLRDIVNVFSSSDLIGVVSNQLRNNPRHFRAPFFAISSKCIQSLEKLNLWNFTFDHDAECRFGDQVAAAGFLSVQLGNGFNLATDYEWNFRGYHHRYSGTPLPTHILEKNFWEAMTSKKFLILLIFKSI